MNRASSYPGRTLAILAAVLLLPPAALSAQAAAAPVVPQNDLLNATLWVSNSVEYKATALMAYQLAKIRLDQALVDKSWTAATEQKAGYQALPPAIVLDVDETVLDNGAYESWLIKTGKDYGSKTYDLWTQSAAGKAIPGALEFFKYAASRMMARRGDRALVTLSPSILAAGTTTARRKGHRRRCLYRSLRAKTRRWPGSIQ
jgi:5'-nucleotidase (lipoprotein e(P4) family)